MFDMRGKTVVVSGANAGIGGGIADALVDAGAALVVWGRRTDRNESAAERLRARGGKVLAQTVDISDEANVDAAFETALGEMGDIYAVVANAGDTSHLVAFQDIDGDELRRITGINQFGTVFTLRAGARHMIKRFNEGRGGGSLILTSSMSHLVGYAGNSAYAMTKGAVDALVRTLAVELGKYGIRVNSIAPGQITSEISLSPEMSAANIKNTPMGRSGRPADIGAAVVYLASEASSFHTGDCLVIDGGMGLQPGYEAANLPPTG